MPDTNSSHRVTPAENEPEPFRAPVETPAMVLEARLQAAGARISTYLRHLPLPERRRHELALEALHRLTTSPGANAAEAEARAMRILRELLQDEAPSIAVVPGPPLARSHMKPEEMDRRPWVRFFLRLWRPVWSATAFVSNTSFIDLLLYALLLAGLHALGASLP